MAAITEDQARRPSAAGGVLQSLRGLLVTQEFILVLVLIVLAGIVGTISPRFLASHNVSDILLNSSYIAVAAIGQAMVIIAGEIDISVGSLIGVLATVAGTLATRGAPIWAAWLVPLIVGPLVGAIIGFFVAYLRIPSIVVTLGALSILQGGLIIATGGAWIYNLPQGFMFAQQKLLGLPIPVYIMIVLTIISAIFMRYTAMGRSVYAVGGNREAARLSGISERRVTMMVFIVNGFMVAIAALMFATQFSSIQSTVPDGLNLTIITAAVVGGVSILGGVGTVLGATIATIFLRAITSGMVFINLSAYWIQAVQGLLILVTVLADLLRRRRQAAGLGR